MKLLKQVSANVFPEPGLRIVLHALLLCIVASLMVPADMAWAATRYSSVVAISFFILCSGELVVLVLEARGKWNARNIPEIVQQLLTPVDIVLCCVSAAALTLSVCGNRTLLLVALALPIPARIFAMLVISIRTKRREWTYSFLAVCVLALFPIVCMGLNPSPEHGMLVAVQYMFLFLVAVGEGVVSWRCMTFGIS